MNIMISIHRSSFLIHHFLMYYRRLRVEMFMTGVADEFGDLFSLFSCSPA